MIQKLFKIITCFLLNFICKEGDTPVKIVFENCKFEQFDKHVGKIIMADLIKEYRKKNRGSICNFHIDKEYSCLDDVYLVNYQKLSGQLTNDEIIDYKNNITKDSPDMNIKYAGKKNQITKITNKPAMIVELLEYELDKKIPPEIVVPNLFNAGKI